MEPLLGNFISPDTLGQYAMATIIDNYQLSFAKEIPIPSKVSNVVFAAYQRRKGILDEDFLKIFSLPHVGKLTEIHLMRCSIEQENVHYITKLLNESIRELSLYAEAIPTNFLDHLNKNAMNLEVFSITGRLFQSLFDPSFELEDGGAAYTKRPCILNAPNLKYFSVKWNCLEKDSGWSEKYYNTDFVLRLLTYFKKLEQLEIWGSPFLRVMTLDNTEFFEVMHSNVTSLVFNDVILSDSNFKAIESLENLEHLDISNGGYYANPGQKLKSLIEKLPKLKSLDISETNLDEPHVNSPTEIYGLQSRKNNPLEFLGLYDTRFGSCKWLNIPAIKISGYSNLEQLTNAARMYPGSMKIAKRWFYHLADLDFEPENIFPALQILLEYTAQLLDFGFEGEFIEKAILILNILLPERDMNFAIRWELLKTFFNICARSDCPHEDIQDDVCEIISSLLISSKELNYFMEPFINLMFRYLEHAPECYGLALHFSRISDEHQKRLFVDQNGLLEMIESYRRIGSYAQSDKIASFWETMRNLMNENSEITEIFLENGVSLFSYSLPILLDTYDTAMTSAAKVFVQIIIQFKDLIVPFLAKDQFLESLIKAFTKVNYSSTHLPEWPHFYLGFILAQFLTMENLAKDLGIRNKLVNAFRVNFENHHILNRKELIMGDELIEPFIDLMGRNDIPECNSLAIWGFFIIIKDHNKQIKLPHGRQMPGFYKRRDRILQHREVLKLSLDDFVAEYGTKYPNITNFAEILRRDPLVSGD